VEHVAEVPEGEATGATAMLYRDIRAVTGCGMVNLIYRHLAAEPGHLEWAWGAVRPLFVSGEISLTRAALVETLELPAARPLPASAFRLVGVDGDAIRAIAAVLDHYNRGNSGNLFAIGALLHAIEAGRGGRGADLPAESPAEPEPLPPILPLDAMTPDVADLVLALSAPVATADNPLIPSLYRHLALWPGFLALGAARVLPMHEAGMVEELAATLHHRADAAAETMARKLSAQGGLPVNCDRSAITRLLRSFTTGPVPTMVVIGLVLRRMLPV